MRKIGFYIATVVTFALICMISCSAGSSRFAAKVNGVGIENKTLDEAVDNFIRVQRRQVTEEEKKNLRKGILEELISAELLYQESRKAKLGNLKKEIDEQFENIKKGFGSEDEFEKALKDRGIKVKELKKDVEKGVYIKTFLDRDIYNNIVISEEQKLQEYEKNKKAFDIPEQVRASHILIRVKEDASDEDKRDAKNKINELRKKALSGEDFAALARDNSDDGSAPYGGDLNYFKRGDMVEEFEETAFSLDKDEISEVLETQFGYHVIKLTDKKEARTLGYEEVASDLAIYLLNQRKSQELNKLVNELREKAKIDIYID